MSTIAITARCAWVRLADLADPVLVPGCYGAAVGTSADCTCTLERVRAPAVCASLRGIVDELPSDLRATLARGDDVRVDDLLAALQPRGVPDLVYERARARVLRLAQPAPGRTVAEQARRRRQAVGGAR